jgi:hypothetical protein
MNDGDDKDDLLKSEFYADLGDAWRDVKKASGTKDTVTETSKLAGKTAWNAAVFSAKFGLKFIKEAPRIMAEQASRNSKK